MKVPLSWLREFVDWPWETAELAERLTMAGVKIEAIETIGAGLRGTVAACVLRVEPHPDRAYAGHWVVELDAGSSPRRQAVAGIANMKPGDVVAYAPPGAVLPGEWRLGVAKLHGVVSEGMLLSLSEFALGEKPREGEGILVLPPDVAPGADLGAVLGLPETVFELDLTPNYAAHCQSVLGVAREVAALTGAGPEGVRRVDPCALARPSGQPAAELTSVTIDAPDLCSRYNARIIRGVTVGPSPARLQVRILAAGMRPINNIVDVTNYVMLESGQPLHAFDYDRLGGRRIVVRRAAPGEGIVTLDGVTRELTPETLVIADASRPVAIAGVMGGENSEVVSKTRNILLEAACFDPRSVRRTATRLGLLSEAAGRFEKGADPLGVEPASARAAALIAEVAGGAVAPGCADRSPRPFAPAEVKLRTARVAGLLGADIGLAEVSNYLRLLGFGVRPAPWGAEAGDRKTGTAAGIGTAVGTGEELLVTVPSWRTDVAEEIDLVEEVARLYGYNRIPATLPRGATTVGTRPLRSRLGDRARRALTRLGFTEVSTFPQTDPAMDQVWSPWAGAALRLANPLSEKQSVMRTGLLGSLVGALVHNLSQAERSLRLFELGTVYRLAGGDLAPGNLPEEKRYLAAVVTGGGFDANWQAPGREPDFFYAKGVAEAVLWELGVAGWSLAPGRDRRLHPGRQAVIVAPPGDCPGCESRAKAGSASAPVELGAVGELHPRLLRRLGLEGRVMALELDLDALGRLTTAGVCFAAPPRYPAVSRDVAVILPDGVAAARIQEVIRRAAGELAADVSLFDVYRGAPVPEGQRSTAWRIVYRAPDRSLTDAEVDRAHAGVRDALREELGGTLR